MVINKRLEEFTPEDIDLLIRENRNLRLENSILKARTHSREWKGGGFIPEDKGNLLLGIIKRGEYISEYSSFFIHLSVSLSYLGAINKDDTYVFRQAFDGFGSPASCKWLIQKNLCVYMIDILIDKKIISETKKDKYTTQFFGIKDPSKTRNTYWYNKSQTPRNYEVIDKIVESNIQITKNQPPIKFESLKK